MEKKQQKEITLQTVLDSLQSMEKNLKNEVETLAISTAHGFKNVDARFVEMDKRFKEVDKRFDQLEENFNNKIDGLGRRIDDISFRKEDTLIVKKLDTRLSKVEKKVGI